VQSLFPLDGGYSLKLTTGKWYTPSGRSIHRERTLLPDGRFVETRPDSLETEAEKKARPKYSSDAGRTVYGGGGITPDVIVPDDTLLTSEQQFLRAIAPKAQQFVTVLNQYALDLKPAARKDFTITPAWRTELRRRLSDAGVTIDAKSEGIEFDLAGQIVPGLQANAGYTLLRIRGPQGHAVRTYVPRNTARASLTWAPAMLPALKLGGAIKYQSNIRRVADATTTSGNAILVRQPGYALVDLMARYDITPHWSLSANLNNLTNKKYLTSLYWDQAYYGAPRTASITIGWKF